MDMMPVTALRWTLDRLLVVHRDAVQAYPDIGRSTERQLAAARALMEADTLAFAVAEEPGQPELRALRREGSPWGAVADVAEELKAVEHSLVTLASRLLAPDDEIRWRLFHLAVLGDVLAALRSAGCDVTSLRPLGARSSGPAYAVHDPSGRIWDLWFEASGAWLYYGELSPYIEATQGFQKLDRALGADLLLIIPQEAALILECKYSFNNDVVARDGYYQAMAYANEVRSRLALRVTSVAIGPENVVSCLSLTTTAAGDVGTSPPSGLPRLIDRTIGVARN